MKDQEMFDGFTIGLVTKAKTNESWFAAEELLIRSAKNPTVEKREKAFYEKTVKTAHALFKELVKCIEKREPPASDVVQKIIKKHHAFTEELHTATKEVYKAMAQLYVEHPEFRKQLDPFHPQLAAFMAEAMKVFADRDLA